MPNYFLLAFAASTLTGALPLASAQLAAPVTVTPQQLGVSPQTQTNDVDGDGRSDILYVNTKRNSLEWVRSTGAGTFAQPELLIPVPNINPDLAQGDVDGDGDGDLDLLVIETRSGVNSGREINVFENLGSAGFAAVRNLLSLPSPSIFHIASADLNGDGLMDIAVGTNQDISVLFGTGGGTFGPQTVLQNIPGSALSLHAGDGDGDGDADLFYGETGGVAFLENLGGGVFAAEVSSGGMPEGASALAIHDLDLDGRPDVIATSLMGTYFLLRRPLKWRL